MDDEPRRALVYFQGGHPFVWDDSEARWLREQCRIVGTLIGFSSVSELRTQTSVYGLPMMLSNEELWVALEKGWVAMGARASSPAELLNRKDASGSASQSNACPVDISRAVKDQIFAGISDMLAKDAAAGRETKRRVVAIKRPTAETTETEIKPEPEPTTKNEEEAAEASSLPISTKQLGNGAWRYPVDRRSSLKLAVFRDLHRQGFVITDGVKFGSDFLVYQGDPALYHSNFQVQVLDSKVGIPGKHLMALSRVARGAKKRLVLATPFETTSFGPSSISHVDYVTVSPETSLQETQTPKDPDGEQQRKQKYKHKRKQKQNPPS